MTGGPAGVRYDANVPAAPRAVGVLLHPHPDYGGDRFHPFVDTLFRRLLDAGVVALRFDFASGDPSSARQQALDVVDAGTAGWPGLPIVLFGYSFGAAVACGIADARLAAWYLLAPPGPALVDAPIGPDLRPKALVLPERDQFSPPALVAERVSDWVATTITVLPDADHFLGAVKPIVDNALAWVAAVLAR
jgi:alpha/beta superfamily hydrolase